MSQNVPPTIVEFVDVLWNPEDAILHKTREVRINGVPVHVKKDGAHFDLDEDGNGLTVLTLELMPTEIRFIADKSYENKQKTPPISITEAKELKLRADLNAKLERIIELKREGGFL